VKNNSSTKEHSTDISYASHDVSLPSTIFFTDIKQAVCERSLVCEANAPLPCSSDIASVLSQWPNEYLEKNKSSTSFNFAAFSFFSVFVFIHAHISLLSCNGKVDSLTVNK
jgi:hypothetical protein